MPIKKALNLLVKKENLSLELTYEVAQEIITGRATPSQIGAFLATLAAKGETTEEITLLNKFGMFVPNNLPIGKIQS